MLIIRFLRVGKKNQPSFKIVVTDKRNPPRGGRFVEQVGFYNPLTKEKILKAERIRYWLSVGAQPSDTVWNLLVSEKIVEGKKIPKHKVKKVAAPEGGEPRPEVSGREEEKTVEEKPGPEAEAKVKPEVGEKKEEKPEAEAS